MSRCKLNTCSKYYYSACVRYTGELITDSYLNLPSCEVTINDVFGELDRIIKELKDNDGILKTLLVANNCSFSHITTLISNTSTDKAKTSDTVIAMLKTMCQLQTRIVELETEDIFEKTLPQEIQNLLVLKFACFNGLDPCNLQTITLKELLMKLIYKLCP